MREGRGKKLLLTFDCWEMSLKHYQNQREKRQNKIIWSIWRNCFRFKNKKNNFLLIVISDWGREEGRWSGKNGVWEGKNTEVEKLFDEGRESGREKRKLDVPKLNPMKYCFSS